MRLLRMAVIVAFAAVLLLPLFCFNFEPDSISEIDNRKLAENPFSAEGDLTNNIENYVNDRIGFRDTMISAYTILNDRLFGKMVHPSYSYGKDGYVFGNGLSTTNSFGDYHIVFADMILAVQNYCESRNVPFLFVFNPAKPAVYRDKIPDGVNYNREWVGLFFAELDKRGIHYLDNTATMIQLSASGTEGFNQKYDANHWNATGAFYGTQKMLERLHGQLPSVHVNDLSEFSVSQDLKTTLLVSNFPIQEYVPLHELTVPFEGVGQAYAGELALHPSYQTFGYYVNPQRQSEGAPRALVFQGSYMNSYGYKYMINAFGEYIHVHDYQNVIDFPYYFNIFQPECVIFEVAEYTFSNKYFSYDAMKAISYNPALASLDSSAYAAVDLSAETITVERGEMLTVITWQTDAVYPYVWLQADGTYDMKAVPGGYQVTVTTAQFEETEGSMQIVAASGN